MTKKEAIKRIQDHMIVHKIYEPKAIYITEALEMAVKALKESEKKRGKWVRDEFGSKCGICNLYAYNFDKSWESPYCPNCGAYMT